jgi:alkanesulfonate monooxygenase SsuD/methylene tetrahydromethanopterin reductase-like flavin-dependent oxidoreductase (luciferase family)
MTLRHGVYLPPFNDLADPRRLMDVAVMAEECGWDGLFLWDHVLRRPEQASDVADPWIALAAIACATTRLKIGTMVTPLARRRPQMLAREVVTLDHLSGGRVILGLGLGVDTAGELSRFGELEDPVARGDLLDEGAELLSQLMSGEFVEHRGRYFVADGVRLLPRPVQVPRVPMWFAARARAARPAGADPRSGAAGQPVSPGAGTAGHVSRGASAAGQPVSPGAGAAGPVSPGAGAAGRLANRGGGAAGRPVRRAASYEGLFLIDAELADLEHAVTVVASTRGSLEGFDVAVLDVPQMPLADAASMGATWGMLPIRPEEPAAEVEALIAEGPPR